MSYAVKWNKIDSFIFFCENKAKELKQAFMDSAETEPDAEVMILAETEHLRSENEKLKKRDYPHKVEIDRTSGEQRSGITCPCCGISITAYLRLDKSDEAYYPKYCFECGNRLWFSKMKY